MKVILIGSGNVATQLGKSLVALGNHQIVQVYSRTLAHAQALAHVLNCPYTSNIDAIAEDADLYLLLVNDSAIAEVVEQLPATWKGIVAHCSGATAIDVLAKFQQYAVIYPVQSFSKEVNINIAEVPFGIEAHSAETQALLISSWSTMSSQVFDCSTEQRLALHTAAVFANNFSNALFQVAYDLLEEHHLSFDLIKPIILKTAEKVQKNIPQDVQTGPAIRNDKISMEKHLQFLSRHPDWQLIYQKISDLITKRG